jgi:hypothetical protein
MSKKSAFQSQQTLWQSIKTAIAQGNLLLVLKLLKQAHLPLDSPDPSNGWPCLFYSIQFHQHDMFLHFLNAFQQIKIITDFERNSALMLAAMYCNEFVGFYSQLGNTRRIIR